MFFYYDTGILGYWDTVDLFSVTDKHNKVGYYTLVHCWYSRENPAWIQMVEPTFSYRTCCYYNCTVLDHNDAQCPAAAPSPFAHHSYCHLANKLLLVKFKENMRRREAPINLSI